MDLGPLAPKRPPLDEISLISGRGLTQIFVTSISPFSFQAFINGEWVSETDLEDLTIHIRAPEENDPPILSGQISLKVETATGKKEPRCTKIFPGTIQIIALGRLLQVSCQHDSSLDTVWVGVGLDENGLVHPLDGIKEVKIFLTSGILDAGVTWFDGTTEKIFQPTQEMVN